jgi:hypothetical protein
MFDIIVIIVLGISNIIFAFKFAHERKRRLAWFEVCLELYFGCKEGREFMDILLKPELEVLEKELGASGGGLGK